MDTNIKEEVKTETTREVEINSMTQKMSDMFATMNRKEKRNFCKKNGISYKEVFRPVTKAESEVLSTVHSNKQDVIIMG